MDQELNDLKSVLRSLVVSSPAQVDVRSLLRDYRSMMGESIPLARYGYRDPLLFLKDRCGDCFLFQGPASNPILTLIVPETLKHIDKFVQKQKLSSTAKLKGKRRSIPGELIAKPQTNLIASTFKASVAVVKNEPVIHKPVISNRKVETNVRDVTHRPLSTTEVKTSTISKSIANISIRDKENKRYNSINKSSTPEQGHCSSDALAKFLKKRLPVYNGTSCTENDQSCDSEKASSKDDTDSGRQTSSSNSFTKAAKLEELKSEIRDLIADYPEGVWCTDLFRLYRERYGREMDFARFGYTSILSLVLVLEEAVHVSRRLDTGDWLVRDAKALPPAGETLATAPRALRPLASRRAAPVPTDPEDALPGIDFDADVFPEDCMHFMDSIPSMRLEGLEAGAMLEIMVGEVYSPSHFWLLRLGATYHQKMEDIMDEMTKYYTWGEGKDRKLSLGAVRVGHYCSSVYESDWHRSLIVRVLDSDTVKVRHVDYGTVETVAVGNLKPLRREWASLPAQAVRARLAGVRPPAAGRRWPHAASAHFLHLVRDARLVANLVCIDKEEDILEVFLINTSTEEDVCISSEMIRSGHADSRSDSALRTSECHLFPRFDALENGDTPNYGEIHGYLRDGIALEFVEEYRRHVPACLPPPPSPTPSPPSLPPPSSPPVSPSSPPLADVIRASAPEFFPASACTPPPPAASNRVPLMQPRPPPAPPRPPPLPPPPSYAGFPPFPGAMPLFPPMYPPPMPMFVPAPPDLVCPPGLAGRPPGPYPRPDPASPAPPLRPTGEVTLTASECEIYKLLSNVEPRAAHWYMADTISRARARSSSLNPEAAEFRLVATATQTEPPVRPPPGFGG